MMSDKEFSEFTDMLLECAGVPKPSAALAGYACVDCQDTGEKVIGGEKDYAIVFCGCVKGRSAAAQQADILSDHGA